MVYDAPQAVDLEQLAADPAIAGRKSFDESWQNLHDESRPRARSCSTLLSGDGLARVFSHLILDGGQRSTGQRSWV
jgi:hypothetical protein